MNKKIQYILLILSKNVSLVAGPALSLCPPVFAATPISNDILSFVGSALYQASLIRNTPPVFTFSSFGTVGSVTETSPFSPGAPPSLIRNENHLIHLL
jgi:hypothetical protein